MATSGKTRCIHANHSLVSYFYCHGRKNLNARFDQAEYLSVLVQHLRPVATSWVGQVAFTSADLQWSEQQTQRYIPNLPAHLGNTYTECPPDASILLPTKATSPHGSAGERTVPEVVQIVIKLTGIM